MGHAGDLRCRSLFHFGVWGAVGGGRLGLVVDLLEMGVLECLVVLFRAVRIREYDLVLGGGMLLFRGILSFQLGGSEAFGGMLPVFRRRELCSC